jgi:hypothetical protein
MKTGEPSSPSEKKSKLNASISLIKITCTLKPLETFIFFNFFYTGELSLNV